MGRPGTVTDLSSAKKEVQKLDKTLVDTTNNRLQRQKSNQEPHGETYITLNSKNLSLFNDYEVTVTVGTSKFK